MVRPLIVSTLQIYTTLNVLCIRELIKNGKTSDGMRVVHLQKVFVQSCWVAGYVDNIVKML